MYLRQLCQRIESLWLELRCHWLVHRDTRKNAIKFGFGYRWRKRCLEIAVRKAWWFSILHSQSSRSVIWMRVYWRLLYYWDRWDYWGRQDYWGRHDFRRQDFRRQPEQYGWFCHKHDCLRYGHRRFCHVYPCILSSKDKLPIGQEVVRQLRGINHGVSSLIEKNPWGIWRNF